MKDDDAIDLLGRQTNGQHVICSGVLRAAEPTKNGRRYFLCISAVGHTMT